MTSKPECLKPEESKKGTPVNRVPVSEPQVTDFRLSAITLVVVAGINAKTPYLSMK